MGAHTSGITNNTDRKPGSETAEPNTQTSSELQETRMQSHLFD
jgi:hypothetical protein